MCLAVPGKLLEIKGEPPLSVGKVDFGGITKEASLAYVPEACLGDYVLVHAGFALAKIDEEEARQVMAYLTEAENLLGEERSLP